MKLPKDIEELKLFFKVLSEPITEPCYKKPKIWAYALGTAAAALLCSGVAAAGLYFGMCLPAKNEVKQKNSEINAIELREKNSLDAKNNIISSLEQNLASLENKQSDATIKSRLNLDKNQEIGKLTEEINKLRADFDKYRQDYPETLLREKSSLEIQLAATQKELDETKRFTERALTQQYVSKEEYAALIADRKKLEQAQATLKQVEWEFEGFKKKCLEEITVSDEWLGIDQEYRSRQQKIIDQCNAILSSSGAGNRAKASAYNNRGNAKASLEQLEAAIKDYTEAIKLFPEAIPYCNRGKAKSNLGFLEDALKDLDKAIELKPDYINAYTQRGVAYARMGRFKEAISDFDAALRLGSKDVAVQHNRQLAYDKLQREELIKKGLDDFILAIRARKITEIPKYQKELSKEQFASMIREYVQRNPDQKIGLAGMWTNAEGHAISDGLIREEKPPLTVTLKTFYETLGIEKTVEYFNIAYGRGMTGDEMKNYVKTHTVLNWHNDLMQNYYLLLTLEEVAKLDPKKTLNVVGNTNAYGLRVFARDIFPDENPK